MAVVQLLIFDFDGVVADSEALANEILAEGFIALGAKLTVQDVMREYAGRRWLDCVPMMEETLGRALPDGFLDERFAAVYSRLIAEVRPVSGVLDFLQQHADTPRCIASSSKLDYIHLCLERMAMAHWFEHRFSGYDVARSKPFPDLFLNAASSLDVSLADCVVIEDSPTGVMAGKAAGMLTIGLCAGSHVLDGHAARLAAAGADHVMASYAEITSFLAEVGSACGHQPSTAP